MSDWGVAAARCRHRLVRAWPLSHDDTTRELEWCEHCGRARLYRFRDGKWKWSHWRQMPLNLRPSGPGEVVRGVFPRARKGG